MIDYQDMIARLQSFWCDYGCVMLQPYNSEVGAGTFNPATFLRAIGPEPWNVAYVEPSKRPKDGRYLENPNRVHQFLQYQVVLKPSPAASQDLYLAAGLSGRTDRVSLPARAAAPLARSVIVASTAARHRSEHRND